jgi:hypothetical protein
VYKEEERKILKSFGYLLIGSDVSIDGESFEDWWIHSSCFSSYDLYSMTSLDLKEQDHTQLIQNLKTSLKLNSIINSPVKDR